MPGHRLRLLVIGLGLAVLSGLAVSRPAHRPLGLRASMQRGADRLLELQAPDGSWSGEVGGPGDIGVTGRPGRALLAAYLVVGDDRYLWGAERAAAVIVSQAPTVRHARSVGNLLFLAEYAEVTGQPRIAELVRDLRRSQLVAAGALDGATAAQDLMARANRTPWLDGAWRNYLLWHAGEQAELARAVGDHQWADTFTLTAAETWAPKEDHAWWVMGAGRMLEELSRVPGARARRLAAVQLDLLASNQVRPGIPWCDTPYDSFAYTLEAAASLQGMLACHDAGARGRALTGLRGMAERQLPGGGWEGVISLADAVPAPGADLESRSAETPELDAEMVLALAMGLRSSPLVRPLAPTT